MSRLPDPERVRALLAAGSSSPAMMRAALESVPRNQRDAWWDAVYGLEDVPNDGPDLPRGCVPYLPCSVNTLLEVVDRAQLGAGDVFVDVGAGVGRVTTLVHYLTGASAIGIEVQAGLAHKARTLAEGLDAQRVTVLQGDAVELVGTLTTGTVFFLYCPFSGERLERVVNALEPIARRQTVHVCCVDLPLPQRPWLERLAPASGELVIYRSQPQHPHVA